MRELRGVDALPPSRAHDGDDWLGNRGPSKPMIDPFAGLPVAALSESRTLFEAGLILVLAAAAPLIAQVLRLPSILLLLALGFGAGAIGALDPNALLGESLISTVVSIAVGIILFEAGLGLNFSKLTGSVARVYRRLVSLGILVTWAVGTVAAYLLFDLSWEVALVLGAVLSSPARRWSGRCSASSVPQRRSIRS